LKQKCRRIEAPVSPSVYVHIHDLCMNHVVYQYEVGHTRFRGFDDASIYLVVEYEIGHTRFRGFGDVTIYLVLET
jgi:hypothetical protein